jgi:hypothetical protein
MEWNGMEWKEIATPLITSANIISSNKKMGKTIQVRIKKFLKIFLTK